MIDKEKIRRQLAAAASHVTIDIRECVTSTNTLLKQIAEQGADEGYALLAQEQTAGKGRLGRTFSSPKGTGLYLSVLLRPQSSAQDALSITTAAAVAVARAIEKTTGLQAKIKWVNDIYVNTYKVCGILAEAAFDPSTAVLRYVVLGIGINIQTPPGGFSPEIHSVAGALYHESPPQGITEALTAELISEFFSLYCRFPERKYMEEYRSRSLLTGLQVHFTCGNERFFGTVLGVDEEARLVIDCDGQKQAFSMGEVAVEKDFLEQIRKV